MCCVLLHAVMATSGVLVLCVCVDAACGVASCDGSVLSASLSIRVALYFLGSMVACIATFEYTFCYCDVMRS